MVIGTGGAQIWGVLTGALIAVSCSIARLHARMRQRCKSIEQDLPFFLDMMTLCMESGLGLYSALQQAERHGPRGYLREELAHALADMRAGAPRAAALRALADRCNCSSVHRWIAALIQADGLGMSIGPLLREHASQCRADRFQRAEKLAMQAPVKMLLPLIACIFPCTFIVLAFPVAMQMWQVAQ
ncbi:type II secretion system F family protein [Bordetella muralis]|uniref:type II secretion system F family protein n=1 Tax=Bordetella muralis TaxID=1649130 RepID=UPI0039EE6F9F